MSDSYINLAFFLCGAMLVLMLMGLLIAIIVPGIERWNRRYFITQFAVLSFCLLSVTVDTAIEGKPDLIPTMAVIWVVDSAALSALMPLLTVFLLHSCGTDWRKSPLFYITIALWMVSLLLLGTTLFSPFIFYASPDGWFRYGPGYPLIMVPLDIIMILNVVELARRRNRLSKEYRLAFFVFSVPLLLTMIIHTFIYDTLFLCAGVAILALSLFLFIMRDQTEQYMNQQREIAHQRANIMVLQMRPHFIYNTMASIYYLCAQNPQKAQQTTLDFTTYLRKNFAAITSEDTIPFSEELEHTRAYLAVEQAQYEDGLLVDYDTPHTQFRIPPLTLQPIVENAVKHGMDPDSEPLRITIQSKKAGSGSEIRVEDNGPGFDAAIANEPHTTLANIRQRLKLMCHGSLAIESRENGGTTVKVTIP
jgi:hypothetical protein